MIVYIYIIYMYIFFSSSPIAYDGTCGFDETRKKETFQTKFAAQVSTQRGAMSVLLPNTLLDSVEAWLPR